MSSPTRSYLKVAYDLRPAKQVERRMLMDAFQRLTHAGFKIADYQYTGFGSVYCVDVFLFPKLLGITKLLSVEHDTQIERRVRFNKPFKEIDVRIAPIGDVIPTLSPDLKHILWLDYDDLIQREHLDDILQAAINLSTGSILLVTVDVEPPAGEDPAEWRRHYEAEAYDYLGGKARISEFAKSKLPGLNAHIISQVIKKGFTGRQAQFLPLFKFLYKDGHQMLTVGGMVTTNSEQRVIRASSLVDAPYYRPDLSKPEYEIIVPRLTRKERLYLDCAMPCGNKWHPKEFELSRNEVLAYREIYRFFPAYAELLL